MSMLIIIGVAFCALVRAIRVPHTPALTPDDAAKELSLTPEFSRHYSGVVVTSTSRAPKSLKDSMYFPEITFKKSCSTSVLHGHAIFLLGKFMAPWGRALRGTSKRTSNKIGRSRGIDFLWTEFCVARPEGLEPPAYWFEANRSIQLSYGRVVSSPS
jgi:hypothetical protein